MYGTYPLSSFNYIFVPLRIFGTRSKFFCNLHTIQVSVHVRVEQVYFQERG